MENQFEPGHTEEPPESRAAEEAAGAADTAPLMAPQESGPEQFGPSSTGGVAPPQHPRRLVRSTSDRMLAGVAAGVADYVGVDPTIVRIGFVLLTFFGGLGILLYVAGWLLIPEEGGSGDSGGSASSGEESPVPGSTRSRGTVVAGLALLAVLFVVVLAVGPWQHHGIWVPGLGGAWLALAAVAVLLLARRTPRPIRRFFTVSALMVLGLVVLSVAAVFSAVGLSGVPLSGGIGDHQWRPTSMAALQSTYQTSIGNATLDLRQVPFTTKTTHVTASVGIGHLLVVVPPRVVVNLNSHAGVGNVTFDDGDRSAFFAVPASASTAPVTHLSLTAEVGVGVVELERASAGATPVTIAVPPLPPKPTPAAPPAPAAPAAQAVALRTVLAAA